MLPHSVYHPVCNMYQNLYLWLKSCMCTPFLIHFYVNGHLKIYLELELLNHMVILCLGLKKIADLFFTAICYFFFLHSHQQFISIRIQIYPQLLTLLLFVVVALFHFWFLRQESSLCVALAGLGLSSSPASSSPVLGL